MKRSALTYCILSLFAIFGFSACDVHEFPDMPERRPYELVLDFTNAIDMGFYQTIDYSRASTEASPSGTKTQTEITYDIRYTVNAYRIDGNDGNRLSDTTIVVCNSDLENMNHTLRLNLRPGKYRFLVWADYVVHGTKTDLYYNTSNFEEIILADRQNHTGSTDRRDAFRGEKEAEVYDNPELTSNSTRSTAVNRVVVEMERPLAKFKFISHDIVKFLSYVLQQRAIRQKEAEMKAQQGVSPESADPKADPKADIKNINTNDFRVVFRYQGFMPCSFNMFTNKPADSWTGVAFDSTMQRLSDTEVELGFDYVFVNGGESTVPVSVEVYDTDGTLLSSTLPIDVPVVRNKLTVVRGNFLSSKASGGVSIRTEFDGEYNLEIR